MAQLATSAFNQLSMPTVLVTGAPLLRRTRR